MRRRLRDWWFRRRAVANMLARMAARPSVLSPAVATELSKLLEKRPSRHDVPGILSGLSALPAQSIARASREIAEALRLGWWRRDTGLMSYFREPLAEAELMRVGPGYAWIFLFHDSGYVRQSALEAIAKPPSSPFFFAALAWRLNDWVGEVRQAAVDCAGRVLPGADPTVTANAALHLLGRRFEWQRWGDDERQALDPIFRRPDVIAQLADLLCERATGPLANALRYALRYPEMDDHLPRLAVDAVQPVVRAIAYRCLVFRKATWINGIEWTWVDKVYGYRRRTPVFASRQVRAAKPVDALIADGIHDRAAAVRWVAAGALLEMRAQLPNAGALITSLAGDRSPAIRSRAEFMMRNPI